MRPQRGQHLVRAESMRVAVGEHACGKRAQPARVLRRRSRFGAAGANERPDPPPRLEDAGALEFAVYACNGVGVDLELDRQLANRRELIATLNLLDETLETVARADLASELVGICSRYEDVKDRVVYPALRAMSAKSVEIDRADEDRTQRRSGPA